MKKITIQFLAIIISANILSGCAVVMAAKQPGKKDLTVLRAGTERGLVLAELGQPVSSEKENNTTRELYKFVQGYSKVTKAGRALFHGAADVFTVGMWEAVATPTEAVFDGSEMLVQVIYDENNKVSKVDLLKGKPNEFIKHNIIAKPVTEPIAAK